MQKKTKIPLHDAFYKKRRSCNPLTAKYTDYVKLLKSVVTTEQAESRLETFKASPYWD